MRRFLFIIVTLLIQYTFTLNAEIPSVSVWSQNKTVDQKSIAGKHLLSLQWISWEKFGSVSLTALKESGKYSCKGSQYSDDKTDWLILDGTITQIDAKHLKFEGTIKTRVSYIAGGVEQVRKGIFDFVASGKRKYWRLQQMDNPGDVCVDYVDIYF